MCLDPLSPLFNLHDPRHDPRSGHQINAVAYGYDTGNRGPGGITRTVEGGQSALPSHSMEIGNNPVSLRGGSITFSC